MSARVSCSFCGKSQDEVQHLFTASPTKVDWQSVPSKVENLRPEGVPAPRIICNACADLAAETFKDNHGRMTTVFMSQDERYRRLEAEFDSSEVVRVMFYYPAGGTGRRFPLPSGPDDIDNGVGFSGGGWHWHAYGVVGSAVRRILFETNRGEISIDTIDHNDFPCRFWFEIFEPETAVSALRLYDEQDELVRSVPAPDKFEIARLDGIDRFKQRHDELHGQ